MPSKQASDDLHLQSTQALSGYPIQTSERAIGHVIDFIIDDNGKVLAPSRSLLRGQALILKTEAAQRIRYKFGKTVTYVTSDG